MSRGQSLRDPMLGVGVYLVGRADVHYVLFGPIKSPLLRPFPAAGRVVGSYRRCTIPAITPRPVSEADLRFEDFDFLLLLQSKVISDR